MGKLMEFENLLNVFEETIDTKEFKQLQSDFNEADNIYFIGNGGNAPVCSHASSDITRLTNKKCSSLDNVSYITSGNSKNIVSSLSWANDRYNISTCLISGQKSNCLDETINEVCFNRGYFHTVEILSELTFYQLIHGTGNNCPTIKAELIRKYGKAK